MKKMIKTYAINGKNIGFLENGIYTSERTAKKHFYIKGRGYPITNAILKQLLDDGCKTVQIIEICADGSRNYYIAPLQNYIDAVLIQESYFEQQRCLPLKLMTKIENNFMITQKQNGHIN